MSRAITMMTTYPPTAIITIAPVDNTGSLTATEFGVGCELKPTII
jgi:hypothetical protein